MNSQAEIMDHLGRLRAGRRLLIAGAAVCLLLLCAPAAALASTPAPGWSVESLSLPTNLAPGSTFASGDDTLLVTATDVGEAPTDGNAITITDTLPAGLSVDAAGATGFGSCSTVGQVLTCASSQVVDPGQVVELQIPVDVAADASGTLTNLLTVSGGGGSGAANSSAISVSSTPAGSGIQTLDGSVTNEDGSSATQAGAHPDQMTTLVMLNTATDSQGQLQAAGGDVKDIDVSLPAGLVGNPQALPQCPQQDFGVSNQTTGYPECPDSTAVGEITVFAAGGQCAGLPACQQTDPVFNLVPPPGEPAEFGFDYDGVPVVIDLHVWPQAVGGYRVTAAISNINQSFRVLGSQLTVWGTPADPIHDQYRGSCITITGGSQGSCPATGASATPLLTLPTRCSSSLTTNAVADSWTSPGSVNADGTPDLSDPNWVQSSYVSHDASGNAAGITGCNQLDFSPQVSLQPDSTVADSPSGISFNLTLPQSGLLNENGLAEASLNDASVKLPVGMSVDPSRANGLGACSEAQIGLGNVSEPTCPDSSKIGTVQITTPLLPDVLTGWIYVAQQGNIPGEGSNPFGSLLAGYIVAQGDGVLIKLPGQITTDPSSGQVTASFDNNPQLPFTNLQVTFWGGEHGALATPTACGTYSATTTLTPWSAPDTGAPASLNSSFSFTSGCVSGFSPSFVATSENAQAGAYSPFAVSFQRPDTSQYLGGLSVKLPPGMLAKLAGVAECSDGQLAAAAAKTGQQELASPSCPAGSQVGTVTAGAGPGPSPYYLSGKAYLTGPYKGAPYGLAVVVPAVAGPFDLGTVVVRQALHVDPTTAQVTDVSDPFPTILQGIPLRLRRVDVILNRPEFTVNPTNCDPMAVTGTLSSTLGISDPVSNRFQVGGCASLGFSPKLGMKLTGKGQTRSGDHPTLTSVLTQKSGQANIHNVRVALPLNLALDPNNSQHVCPYATAQAVTTGPANCPASTLVGHATAVTPLLSQPLTGPVYLVQGIRYSGGVAIHTLPSLLIPLRGQIALDLRAQTSVSHGKLVTTFPTIPDAAVSKFTLTINGGKKGILVITGRGRTICGSAQVTQATLAGQNGKAVYPNIKMSTPCRAHHARKRHHRRHH